MDKLTSTGGSSIIKLCKHEYQFLCSKKWKERCNSFNSDSNYHRIDEFYCKFCLEIEVREKHGMGKREEPDWY